MLINADGQQRGQQTAKTVETPALSSFERCNIKEANLSVDELREVFRYDNETGFLHWKISPARNMPIGSVAGTTTKEGYRRVNYKGFLYFTHRIIWAINTGAWPINEIDHSKGDTGNNRFKFLREAGRSQNEQNKSIRAFARCSARRLHRQRTGQFRPWRSTASTL
jgi:hypothetical protein